MADTREMTARFRVLLMCVAVASAAQTPLKATHRSGPRKIWRSMSEDYITLPAACYARVMARIRKPSFRSLLRRPTTRFTRPHERKVAYLPVAEVEINKKLVSAGY
jgi:hypothetical protein